MELVADRFVITHDGGAIDLATNQPVLLVTSIAGGPSDLLRWTSRCDRLNRISHPSIARLLDYGLLGETQRFEAWRSGGAWRADNGPAGEVCEAAARYMRASGLTPPAAASASVRTLGDLPIVVPDAGSGYEAVEVPASRGLPVELHAVSRIERAAFGALADVFKEPRARHPRIVSLWGSPGAGVRTAVGDLSRVARLNGFVPVEMPCSIPGVGELLDGRSLLLICWSGPGEGWRHLIEWSLESPRSHVLLFAGTSDVPHVAGVELGPVSPERLMASVLPGPLEGKTLHRIEQCARRAGGRPGRFVRLMWGARYDALDRVRRRSVAAEQSTVYGEDPPRPVSALRGVAGEDWPSADGLAPLRRRLDTGIEQLRRGRHAPGHRLVRQTIGALARRHDWHHAVRGLLALGAALLNRGRPTDAQAALREAKQYATDHDQGALVDVAVLTGVAWTDTGRLDEAEAVLHGACGAARSTGESDRIVASGLAFARCLFWRGEYDRAEGVLDAAERQAAEGSASVRIAALRSRLAVGRRDLPAAVSRASVAADEARGLGDPALLAGACYALAFAHLAVGDLAAVGRDIAAAVHAARMARDPLCALKARLVGAEGARRAGQSGVAAALLRRVKRIPAANLPATVRARAALLNDLLVERSDQHADVVRRHLVATGVAALRLFGPNPLDEQAGVLDRAVGDVLDILQCCESVDDERSVLGEICGRLRVRLNAAAVAVFAKGDGVPLASVGVRIDSDVGDRVLAARQPIAPHVRDGRIEGGAPVRYAGDTIGTIVGRWPLGGSCDLSRASAALTMAAGAAGAALAAAVACRAVMVRRPTNDLLGVSGAMADVRRAVERAAAAPFAVLIEGESGCGKELVARALHRQGPRSDRPFCTLNCAALPEDLVETELFGHARGAFTGALADRIGVFEEAHGGTVFLDEIGELSSRAQAKILRTIQEGEVRRVGENASRRIDVRIVSATNRDLRQTVAAGSFRADLMYRLDVIRISIPPLRERREDVAVLAEHFWREAAERMGSHATLASSTVAALAEYEWSGNVRELQNVLASLAVRGPKRGVVAPEALPAAFRRGVAPGTTWRLDAARRTFEEQFIRAALVRTGGHRSRAAVDLGLTRQGLAKVMARLGIGEAL